MSKKRDPNAIITNADLDLAINHLIREMQKLFSDFKTHLNKRFDKIEKSLSSLSISNSI